MTSSSKPKFSPLLAFAVGALAIVGMNTVFTVHETEQVLVLRFGNPVRVIQEPGLQFKAPLIENLVVLDRRILDVDPRSEEVLLKDQKRLVVDTFLRYQIVDPLQFYQTLGSENAAIRRLQEQVNSSLRSNLGRVALPDLLSEKRKELMTRIRQEVNKDVNRLGLRVADVRIVRADLPAETSQAIFARMVSERQREAAEARAEGQELAQEIRSKAERDRTVLLANAEKTSQITRGEGDEKAIQIYANAFQQDAEFYSFYRSLEAYRKTLADENKTLILSPESDFFNHFQKN